MAFVCGILWIGKGVCIRWRVDNDEWFDMKRGWGRDGVYEIDRKNISEERTTVCILNLCFKILGEKSLLFHFT